MAVFHKSLHQISFTAATQITSSSFALFASDAHFVQILYSQEPLKRAPRIRFQKHKDDKELTAS